ncbi:MAG: hypothetical protein JWM11_5020 [Planctomycetaceae bacterium]|nr:hypothetical protein [Planctomycetaceae bacterium]
MLRQSIFSLMTLSATLVAMSVTAQAADTKAAEPPKVSPASAESKARVAEITPTDIGKSLQLSLPNVATLGQRIGAARKAPDPVTLALLAVELDAMEKISGKKAKLTADALTKEAIGLVKMRHRHTELLAVSAILAGKEGAGELPELAKKAESDHDARKKAQLDGIEKKGLHTLTVVNFTGMFVHIHVHGVHHGEVAPHSQRTFHLHEHYHFQNSIHLSAHAFRNGEEIEWEAFDHFSPKAEHFTWRLHGD